jgi:hypothetical protein
VCAATYEVASMTKKKKSTPDVFVVSLSDVAFVERASFGHLEKSFIHFPVVRTQRTQDRPIWGRCYKTFKVKIYWCSQ